MEWLTKVSPAFIFTILAHIFLFGAVYATLNTRLGNVEKSVERIEQLLVTSVRIQVRQDEFERRLQRLERYHK